MGGIHTFTPYLNYEKCEREMYHKLSSKFYIIQILHNKIYVVSVQIVALKAFHKYVIHELRGNCLYIHM